MFLSFCVLGDFFRLSKKSGFSVFLVHPTVVSVLLSASVERCIVSRMQDFFYLQLSTIIIGGKSDIGRILNFIARPAGSVLQL